MIEINEDFNQMISEIEKTFDSYIMIEYREIQEGFIYEKERISNFELRKSSRLNTVKKVIMNAHQ